MSLVRKIARRNDLIKKSVAKLINTSVGDGCPTRLFIGGLHGEEYKVINPIIKKFAGHISKNKPKGRIILCSLSTKSLEYISTLDEAYYESKIGKKLLSLIDYYRPSIYLELHSYSDYSSLTDPDRIKKRGVPPLVDLGSGLLAGSISPFLRTKFLRADFCFLLDIPKKIKYDTKVLEIMEMIARGATRKEIVEKLIVKYPKMMEPIVIKNYLEFYGSRTRHTCKT